MGARRSGFRGKARKKKERKEQPGSNQVSRSGFLYLGTLDVFGQILLCVEAAL